MTSRLRYGDLALAIVFAAGSASGAATADSKAPASTNSTGPGGAATPPGPDSPVPAEPTTDGEPPLGDLVDEEIIVVTGTRSATPREASPVTTEVINRQRILESGVQTAAEALALRPGLWIERGIAGTNGISMQGLGPQYSLVLVDGARQIGRTDGVLDLDRFSVEDLEQIEVVRGPSSVLYGSDALGGVVNLVTRTPREGLAADALARVDGRLGYEARGRIAGGKKGYAAALIGSYRESDAITLDDERPPTTDDPTTAAPVSTTFDAYKDFHLTARGTRRDDGPWRIDASADYLRRDLRGIDSMATGAVLDRRNLVETAAGQAGAGWTGERTAMRLEAGASRYRDQYLADQRMGTSLDQYQLTDENLFEARAQVARQHGQHKGLIGGEMLRETLASDRLVEPGERWRAALFAQDEWRLGSDGDVIVVPAARLDTDTQFGVHGTPRIAARWQIHEAAVVRGSVGMGYRAPSFKELLLQFANPGAGYVVEGNPDLEPETSVSGQAGGEWQATSWLWLSSDVYINRLREMIFIITQPDDGSGTLRFGYDNIGRARTLGGELFAIAVRGRAAIEVGYALTKARDLDAERALEGIPAQRVTATLRWRDQAQRFDAFATAVMTGHRPLYLSADPQDATYTPRRVEVRARVAKRFANGVGGFLGVDNLFDAGDATLDRVLPRTLYAGVEAHL